jgi:hypothetical protein
LGRRLDTATAVKVALQRHPPIPAYMATAKSKLPKLINPHGKPQVAALDHGIIHHQRQPP